MATLAARHRRIPPTGSHSALTRLSHLHTPAAIFIALTILRTTLEDRLLRRDLPGYADFANRVRNRLVPELW